MSETPKRGRGRPPGPVEDRYRTINFKFPPDLLEAVREWIPPGERSALAQRWFAEEVERRKTQPPDN